MCAQLRNEISKIEKPRRKTQNQTENYLCSKYRNLQASKQVNSHIS